MKLTNLQSIKDFYEYAQKLNMENAPVAFVIGDKQIVFDKKDMNSNYVYGESKSSLIDGVAFYKHERFIINLKDKD